MVLYTLFFHFKSCLFLYLLLTLSLDHNLKSSAGINEAQVYDQSSLDEEKLHQDEKLKKDDQPPCYENNDDSVEEEPEVSELILSTLRCTEQMKKGKKAVASG